MMAAAAQPRISLDLLVEPVLLVAVDGAVLAANRAAREQLVLPPDEDGPLLTALAEEPAQQVLAMLRRGAGTGEPLPGVLHMPATGGKTVPWRCDFARCGEDRLGKPIVLVQLRRHAAAARSFMALNDKIGQLSREVVVRRAMEQRLTALLREKETLIREIHHRVKNNLQIVSSLIHLQCRQVADPAARNSLMDLEGRIGAMGIIHRRLYEAEGDGQVRARQYIGEVCERIRNSQGRDGLDLHLAVDDLPMSLDDAVPLGLIVFELVSNACRHAFPAGTGGRIEVGLRQRGDSAVLLVGDDGIGLRAGALERDDTFGIQLVRALAQQIGGKLRRDDGPGTRIRLTFPCIAEDAPAA